MNGLPPEEKFLRLYNSVDEWLRRASKLDRTVSFSAVVNQLRRNPKVAYYVDDLKMLAELRNHIVHERRDPQQDCFAIPNQNAIQRLETIWQKLSCPPVLGFELKQVKQFFLADTIGTVVSEMASQTYSQVPVYDGNRFSALLTTNTIALWLGACCPDGLADLGETTLEKVLAHQEFSDNYMIMARNTPIAAAVDAFRKARDTGRPIDAILVTERGRPEEKPISIFSVIDLPRLFDMVKY